MYIISYLSHCKQRHSIQRPCRARESWQHFSSMTAAAVVENKQSLAPTLHKDCGINKSSLGFMMNSSGLASPFYNLRTWTKGSFNSSRTVLCVWSCLTAWYLPTIHSGQCWFDCAWHSSSEAVKTFLLFMWAVMYYVQKHLPLLFSRGRSCQHDEDQCWALQSVVSKKYMNAKCRFQPELNCQCCR